MTGVKLVDSALDEALGLFRSGDFFAGQARIQQQFTQNLDDEDLKNAINKNPLSNMEI